MEKRDEKDLIEREEAKQKAQEKETKVKDQPEELGAKKENGEKKGESTSKGSMLNWWLLIAAFVAAFILAALVIRMRRRSKIPEESEVLSSEDSNALNLLPLIESQVSLSQNVDTVNLSH